MRVPTCGLRLNYSQERAAQATGISTGGRVLRSKSATDAAVTLLPPATPLRQTARQQLKYAAAVAGVENSANVGSFALAAVITSFVIDAENAAAVSNKY
jgi:hypothetical protein